MTFFADPVSWCVIGELRRQMHWAFNGDAHSTSGVRLCTAEVGGHKSRVYDLDACTQHVQQLRFDLALLGVLIGHGLKPGQLRERMIKSILALRETRSRGPTDGTEECWYCRGLWQEQT